MVEATKLVRAEDQVAARDMAENSKHTWRDIIQRAMVGRLVELENYGEVVSQYNLDILGDQPGMIVMRTETGWVALAIGANGQILNVTDGLPAWVDQYPPGTVGQALFLGADGAEWSDVITNLDQFGNVDGMVLRRVAGLWQGLPIGADDQVLTLASGLPVWADIPIQPFGAGSYQRLVSNVVPVGIPAGTTATVDLQTYTLPAGTLANNGDRLQIFASGTRVSSSNNTQPRLVFGGTSLGQNLTTTSQIIWQFKATITRIDATHQIFDAEQWQGTSAGISANVILRAKPTENLATAITIKTTGGIVVATLNGLVSEVLQVDIVR
jgi:hypothetical protein